MIGNELKVYDGLTSRQQLNLFRNLYYNDGNATEYGIIANAINDCFTADVVPKSEVEKTIAEFAYLHADALNKLDNAKTEVAREIFEKIEKMFDGKKYVPYPLDAIAELKKKYTEGAE